MNNDEQVKLSKAVERVGMVLGAMYASHLGDVDQAVKAERLSRCGFSNMEIGALLGTTTNAVNVALHRARKASRRTHARPGKKK